MNESQKHLPEVVTKRVTIKDLLEITKRLLKEARQYGILYGNAKKHSREQEKPRYGIPH